MRSGEKPFEILSSKEKEAFELAAEILLWSSDPFIMRWPGVGSLRYRATQLYTLVSEMDIEYDDRYYRLYEELGKLQQDYKRIRASVEESIEKKSEVTLWIDINKDDPKALLPLVQENLHKGIRMVRLLHNNTSEMPYGDWIQFSFWQPLKDSRGDWQTGERVPDRYVLATDEMFDHSKYKEPYSFEKIRKALAEHLGKPFEEIGSYDHKLHDFGGPEYCMKFGDLTWEEIEKRFSIIIETIKANPRQPKPGK